MARQTSMQQILVLPPPMEPVVSNATTGLSPPPAMHIKVFPTHYTLCADLGEGYTSEMVTVAIKKGDRIQVIADSWAKEIDCRHEWQMVFTSHDVDMSAIRAGFIDQTRLVLVISRKSRVFSASLGLDQWKQLCLDAP